MSSVSSPVRLNQAVITEFRKMLVSGAFQDEAARALGFGERTVKRWKQRGEAAIAKEESGEALEGDEPLYRDYARMVNQARGEAVVYAHARIRDHMRTNWRAAAWYLAMVDPQRYASRHAREEELPTPEQVAREAVASGDVPAEQERDVVVAIEQFLERKGTERGLPPRDVTASTEQPGEAEG